MDSGGQVQGAAAESSSRNRLSASASVELEYASTR